jgi:uncharacterized protein
MLFSRRSRRTPAERVREAVWPQMGWLRTVRYSWLRMLRTPGSPHAIAIGFAAGIFAAFVPVLGIQMALAAALAYTMRGSLMGALAGTCIGTPLTYPLMWLGSYRLGAWMLGHDAALLKHGLDRLWVLTASGTFALGSRAGGAAAATPATGGRPPAPATALQDAGELLAPLLKPLLIGGCALGLAAAALAYYSVSHVIERQQANRRARLMPAPASGQASID